MPERIQLRRTKGWRKPEGAVVVARPSPWGNPFPLDGGWITWTAVALGYTGCAAGRRTVAVGLHRAWLTGERLPMGPHAEPSGGYLEFGDGTEVAVSDQARGVAAIAAAMNDAPTAGTPPHLAPLAGRDLACWCPLVDADGNRVPCHADVLLEMANA